MTIRGKKVILTWLVFLVLLSTLNLYDGKSLQTTPYDNAGNGSFSSTPLQWGITKLVSTESYDEAGSPEVAVDSLGNLHFVWVDRSNYSIADLDYDIVYKKWNRDSRSWDDVVLISTGSTANVYRPSMVIDSHDNIHIVWPDSSDIYGAGSDQDIFYKQWVNSSSSWKSAQLVSVTSSSYSDLPSVAVDSSNSVHIVWKEFYLGTEIAYICWNSSTLSWGSTEFISTESSASVSAPSIAIDASDNIHVVWPDESNIDGSGIDSDIVYKFWNSSNYSWSLTEVVSTESTEDCWSSTLTTDHLGNVHVLWKDYTQFPDAKSPYWSIAYNHLNASSLSWGATEVVNKESQRYSDAPCIVADSLNNLHVVWFEYGITSTEEILYNHWLTTSRSWSSTKDLTTETYYSVSPDLAIDNYDNLYLAWMDYTNYDSSGNDPDIYYKKRVKDFDRDGMPDNWEKDNGLNTTVDDSSEDPDGDGLTNLEEYQYNTNPQAADSDG
ncbi:MAG: hypothetical protein ACXABJ_03970, partial [Candidatus Heimdallarchaeaceae archaeon]